MTARTSRGVRPAARTAPAARRAAPGPRVRVADHPMVRVAGAPAARRAAPDLPRDDVRPR